MKYLLSCYLLLFTYCLHADVPGNKPRSSYDLVVNGLQENSDFIFYNQSNYEAPTNTLKNGDTLHVIGGFGRPQTTLIWATNTKTNSNTDTLYFYGGEYKGIFTVDLNIIENHLTYTFTNKNISTEKGIIMNGSNSANPIDETSVKNKKIMYAISSLSLLFLVALALIIWNKDKKKNTQTK